MHHSAEQCPQRVADEVPCFGVYVQRATAAACVAVADCTPFVSLYLLQAITSTSKILDTMLHKMAHRSVYQRIQEINNSIKFVFNERLRNKLDFLCIVFLFDMQLLLSFSGTGGFAMLAWFRRVD